MIISSYGIVAYVKRDDGKPLFLLHQKRDTFAYVEFVRGLWNYETQVPTLFSHMTIDERQRLTRYTFRELWDDLWVDTTSPMYEDGYHRALKKFETLSDSLPTYLRNTETHLCTPHWAFPKGRRENNESPLQCAKREFTEETRLDSEKLNIHYFDTMYEDFYGLNGKHFETLYYLASYPTPEVPKKIPLPGRLRDSTISSEAYDIRWMPYEEAIKHLEPFRRTVLDDAVERMIEMERPD